MNSPSDGAINQLAVKSPGQRLSVEEVQRDETFIREEIMKTFLKSVFRVLPMAALLATTVAAPQDSRATDDKPKMTATKTEMTPEEARLVEEIRRQLVMLPWYGVFDNFEFSIQGSTVTLSGQVTRPTLKSDAEAVVSKVAGVENVVNNIEVLPLSPNDDRIRLDVYRAIFSFTGLDQYALRAVPPIHIVVRNGHVTLSGVVNRAADRDQAEIVAKGVSGVFSVTNNLRLEER